MPGTPSPDPISTKLERIATLARHRPALVLTSLAHHIDVALLREAYRRIRKDGAVGVDGQTAAAYAANLETNLQTLLDRFKAGTYHAPPVRRVHIAKGRSGKTRPIGIPTFEDKILQRAVAMVLEAVYEQDFLPCSYGFRPGRSAHQALQILWEALTEMHGGWVLEVDIQSFFDTLDHERLRLMLDQRVRDGVLRRTINKWLKAGVLEAGAVRHPTTGTPQGGVISPLLANIYLHEVLDQWFETVVKPRMQGRAQLIRYADDIVILFSLEHDARRVLAVLSQAFQEVRAHDPRRENAAGGFSSATRPGPPSHSTGHLRSPRLHALLGEVVAGEVGAQAEDGPQPSQPGGDRGKHLVPHSSSPSDRRTTLEIDAHAPRALRVLRNHRQFPLTAGLPRGGGPWLAEMA